MTPRGRNRFPCNTGKADMSKSENERQLEINRRAYKKIQAKMEQEHMGEYALMHDGEVVEISENGSVVYAIGCERFGLGCFSIEKVGEFPHNLGIHGLIGSSG